MREIDGLSDEARLTAIEHLLRDDALASSVMANAAEFGGLQVFWEICHLWWRDSIKEQGTRQILIDCAVWLESANASEDQVVFWAARLAWYHRGRVHEAQLLQDVSWLGEIPQLFLTTTACSALRFLFKFKELEQATLPAVQRWPNNQYLQVLQSFSLLGQNNDRGDEQIRDLWHAVADLDGMLPGLVRRACLDALWVARPTEDRMRRLREYCEYMLHRHRSDDRDYITLYLLAFACRHLKDYEAAFTAIDGALARLRGDSVEFLNDQLLRERDFIAAERRTSDIGSELNRVAVELQAARGDITTTKEELARQSMQQTVRLVEALGLFSGIVAFLLSGFTIGAAAESVWQALALIVGTGVTASGFFIVVMVIAHRVWKQ